MLHLTPGGELNFIGCIVMLGTSSIFVALRSYVQIRSKQYAKATDWFCFLSLLVFMGHCAYVLSHIFTVPVRGAFAASPAVSPEKAESLMKLNFACSLLFINGITLAKLSILACYRTFFDIQRQYRHIIMGAAALCMIWWGCFILVTIFQCNPTQAMWTMSSDSRRCLPAWKLIMAAEISNLAIDVIIILTPILGIHRLQLSNHMKWMVAGIFLVGASVVATSVLRLEAIGHFDNEYDDTSKAMFYSTIQFGLAIICACLLPLKQLFFRKNKTASKSRTSVYDDVFREQHVSIPAYSLAGQLMKAKQKNGRVQSITRPWASHDVSQSDESIRQPPAVRINQ